MGLSLLAPLGLLALLAWLVPLWIHRVRRPDTRPVAFAALRWLRTEVRPQHQRRMDEWWLLCLRLLLLATLALWLAQPMLHGRVAARDWQLIEPGIPASQWPAPHDAERRWLAPGFPLVEDRPSPPIAKAGISSLLREADMRAPAGAQVSVVLARVQQGWDAERPKLSRTMTFHAVDVAAGAQSSTTTAPPRLALHADAAHAAALRWFRASHDAWQSVLPQAQRSAAHMLASPNALPEVDRTLVWLDDAAPPAPVMDWVRRGGTLLLPADARMRPEIRLHDAPTLWRDDLGQALLRGHPFARGRVLQLQRPLTASAWPGLLEPAFPAQLQRVLQPPQEATRASANTLAPSTGAPPWPQAPRALQHWLAVIAAILCLLERIVANLPARVRVRG